MSIKGSAYRRFKRAPQAGKLSVVLIEARELPHMDLDDALEVLALMAREGHRALIARPLAASAPCRAAAAAL